MLNCTAPTKPREKRDPVALSEEKNKPAEKTNSGKKT
jgi:hypothetical protein